MAHPIQPPQMFHSRLLWGLSRLQEPWSSLPLLTGSQMTLVISLMIQLIFAWDSTIHGLPRWLSGKESAWQCRRHKRCGFSLPTWVFLPGEFHGQRCLAGYSPWGHKELDTSERTHTHHHSSFSALYFPHLGCLLPLKPHNSLQLHN